MDKRNNFKRENKLRKGSSIFAFKIAFLLLIALFFSPVMAAENGKTSVFGEMVSWLNAETDNRDHELKTKSSKLKANVAVILDASQYNFLESTSGLRESALSNIFYLGSLTDTAFSSAGDLLNSGAVILNETADKVAENRIIIPAAPRPEVSISENWFVSVVDSIKKFLASFSGDFISPRQRVAIVPPQPMEFPSLAPAAEGAKTFITNLSDRASEIEFRNFAIKFSELLPDGTQIYTATTPTQQFIVKIDGKQVAEQILKSGKSTLAPFTQDFVLERARVPYVPPESPPLITPEQRQLVIEFLQKVKDYNYLSIFSKSDQEKFAVLDVSKLDDETLAKLANKIAERLPEIQQIIKETQTIREVQTKQTTIITNEAKLNELTALIEALKIKQEADRQALFNMASLGQRINNISNVTITNPTFSAGSITDADIPDTITASNYLPLGGGTITATLKLGADAPLYASSTLQVSDAVRLYSTLKTDGAINASSTLQVDGAVRFYGDLTIDGTANIGSITLSNPVFSGNTTTGGDLYVNGGDINLGTGTATSTITSIGGNLGIATTSPYSGFSVWGSGTTTSQLFSLINNASSTLVQVLDSGSFGIGTTSPGALLAVQGNALFSGNLNVANIMATGTLSLTGTTGTSTITSNLDVLGNLQIGSICINCGSGGGFTGGTTTVNNLIVTNFSTSTFVGGLTVQTNKFVVDNQTGNVGIGTTTPSKLFSVHGDSLFSGNIFLANLTATGTLTIAGNTTLSNASTTGMLTIGNGFISQASSTISNSLQVAGLLQASSSLSVGGGTALGSTLSVTGTSTIAGLSAGFGTFSSNLITSKDLSVSGLANLTGFISSASSTVSGDLHVGGVLNASSTLLVANLSTLSGGFISQASSTINSNLLVSGFFNASNTANINTLNLVNQLTVANGGTGSTTLTGLLKGNGTSAIQTAVGGIDYEFPLTFSNMLTRSGNVISGSTTPTFSGITSTSTLNVTGDTYLANASTTGMLTIGNGFISNASSTVNSSLLVSGVLNASSSMAVTGGGYFGGNVGIGTNNPTSKLEITGSTNRGTTIFGIGTDSANGVLKLKSIGTTAGDYSVTSDVAVTGYNAILNIGASATGEGQNSLHTRGGALLATDLGKVGIGTTTPESVLSVSGLTTLSAPLALTGSLNVRSTNNQASIIILDAYTPAAASRRWSISNNYTEDGGLAFGQSTTNSATDAISNPKVVFSSTGNVGIGTTTPGALLAVHGNALISGTTTVRALVATSSSLTVGGNKLVVDGSGKVGIGTSNPTKLLEIVGISSIFQNTGISGYTSLAQTHPGLELTMGEGLAANDYTPAVKFMSNDSAFTSGNKWLAGIVARIGQGFDNDTRGGASLDFLTSPVNMGAGAVPAVKMTISQNGNVGIGTTTPGALLAVQGTSLFTGTLTAPNIIATGTLTITGNASFANASTTGMLTIGNGFISQASSTISNSLQVAGLLQASSSLSVGGGTALGSTLSVTGTSTLAGLSAGFGTFSSNLVTSGSLNVTGTSTLSGLSAGFGTFSSNLVTSKDLSVSGLANLTGFISSASSTISNSLHISGNFQASSTVSLATTTITVNVASGTPGIPLTLLNTQSATNTANRLAFQISGATSTLTTSAITSQLIQNYDPGKGILAFSVLNSGLLSEAARFDSNGFFGIGTTTPGALLAVQGTGLFTGTLTAPNIIATGTLTTTGLFTFDHASGTQLTTTNSTYLATAGGRVGIGTADPSSPLHVVGAIRMTESGDTNNIGIIQAASDYLWLDSYGTAANSGGIYFRVNDAATTAMTILANGNVGIGTTSPGALLAVHGNALIAGTTTVNSLISTSTALLATQGGNVGIGTSSPMATLDVKGDAKFGIGANRSTLTTAGGLQLPQAASANPADAVAGTISFNNRVAFFGLNSGGTYIKSTDNDSTDGIKFLNYAGTELARIMDAGNVGIGTTSPGALLAVQGTGLFTGTLTAPNIIATGTLTIAGNASFANASTTGMLTIGNGFISNASSTVNSNLLVSGVLNASSSMAVTGRGYFGGKVGIGTTSPTYELSVEGSGADVARISLNSKGNNDAQMLFTQEVLAGSSWGIGLDASNNDAFSFAYNASGWPSLTTNGLLTIDTSGRLGIGTTSPGQMLSVNGNALIAGTTTVRALVATSGIMIGGTGGNSLTVGSTGNITITNTTPTLSFVDTEGGHNDPSLYVDSSILYIREGLAGNVYHAFSSSDTGDSYVQRQGGNFGIGTTTPGALLAVHGNALIAGTTTVKSLVATSTLAVGGSNFVVDASGKVGIGTLTPTSARLTVQTAGYTAGTQADGQIQIFGSVPLAFTSEATLNPTLNRWGFKLREVSEGDLSIYSYTNSATRLLINNSGYVGIGTTSPDSLLHLWNASSNTYLSVGVQATGNAGIILDSANGDLSGSDYFTIIHDRTTNSLQQGYAGAATFNISSVGNVGVGTTTPGAKLAVNNTGAGLSMLVSDETDPDTTPFVIDASGNVGIGTSNPIGKLQIIQANETDASTGLVIKRSTTDSELDIGYNTAANAFQIASTYGSTGAYLPLTFYTTSAERMRILANGNVGIGTTTPGALLAVHGDALIAGTTTVNSLVATNTIMVLNNNDWTMTNATFNYGGNVAKFGVSGAAANFGAGIWQGSTQQAHFYGGGMSLGSYVTSNPPANGLIVSGNVGIGTTTPYGLLSIEQGTENASLWIGNTGSSTPSLVVKGANGNGYVGIGTNNPTSKLEIRSNSSDSAIAIVTNNNGVGYGLDIDPTGAYAGMIIRGTTQRNWIYGSLGIGVGATSPPSLGLLVGGNTGIGTTSPGALLAVHGNALIAGTTTVHALIATSSSLSVGGSNFVVDASGKVGIGRTSPQGELHVGDGTIDSPRLIMNGDVSPGIDFYLGVDGTLGTGQIVYTNALDLIISNGKDNDTADIIFKTKDTQEVMRLTGLQNVGIGSTTPGTLLSVGGDAVGINFTLATSTFSTTGGINLKSGCFAVGGTCISSGGAGSVGSATLIGQVPYYAAAGTTLTATSTIYIGTNSRVSVGTTTTDYNFAVAGRDSAFNSSADGSLGAWATSSNSLPVIRYAQSSVVANGYVYVIGGWDTTVRNTVFYAKLNSNGSVGAWATSSNALPDARYNHSSVVANGYVYVIGGQSGTAQTTVYYAKLNSNGSTGAWVTNTNVLPAIRYGQSSVAANGYVYAIGGYDDLAAQSTIYYAKLNGDGSTGPWATNVNALPEIKYLHSSNVANGYVYVIGGTGTRTAVYYAKLNSDGSTGAWATNANALPEEIQSHTSVVANGYVYVLGGYGAAAKATVYYAKLNSDGSTGSWVTNANALLDARYNPSSVVANGYVYVIGGKDSANAIKSTIQYSSIARTKISGNLDLLGFASTTLGDMNSGGSDGGSVGGSIFAGNIFSAGRLEVTGNTQLWNGLSVNGVFSMHASSTPGNLVFSITSATSSSAISTIFSVSSTGSTTASSLMLNNPFDVGSSTPLKNTLYKENIVKGWVHFIGSSAVIRDAFNVSSISDDGTGDFTITWDTDFATKNYSVVAMETDGNNVRFDGLTITTGTVNIETLNPSSSGYIDVGGISVIAIGDQ